MAEFVYLLCRWKALGSERVEGSGVYKVCFLFWRGARGAGSCNFWEGFWLRGRGFVKRLLETLFSGEGGGGRGCCHCIPVSSVAFKAVSECELVNLRSMVGGGERLGFPSLVRWVCFVLGKSRSEEIVMLIYIFIFVFIIIPVLVAIFMRIFTSTFISMSFS